MSFSLAWAKRPGRQPLMGFAALLLAAPLGACDETAEVPASAAPAPPAVTVVSVQPMEVTPGFSFIGRVVAVEKVQLRARVAGFLDRRLFAEGSDVEQGDLLFVIEQTAFEAEVARAEAQIARAQASLAEAQTTRRRIQEGANSGAVSRQELDQATAAEQRCHADLLAAMAKLEIAELNLSYTKIYAPIAGRIGRSDFSVGNLIGPDSGVLASIVSQDPIYVTFPVGQRQLLAHRDEYGEPVVNVTLPDGTLYAHPGKLNFLDIRADAGTDMVTVRAELPNPDGLLVDGQFVGVRVERGAPELVLAVPEPSVQTDHSGPYVLVVGADDKVEARPVALGDEVGARVVVREGLQQGERVIVEGLQKVRPGIVVTVGGSAALPEEPIAMRQRGAR